MVKNDRYRGMDEFMPLYLFNEKKVGENWSKIGVDIPKY